MIYAPRSPDGDALWEYCAQRGWDEVRVVSDADLLMRTIRVGKVDIVLCSKLNRLGRSFSELDGALIRRSKLAAGCINYILAVDEMEKVSHPAVWSW